MLAKVANDRILKVSAAGPGCRPSLFLPPTLVARASATVAVPSGLPGAQHGTWHLAAAPLNITAGGPPQGPNCLRSVGVSLMIAFALRP